MKLTRSSRPAYPLANRGITELIHEINGLKSQSGVKERVVVIGATNRLSDLSNAVLQIATQVVLLGEKETAGEWYLSYVLRRKSALTMSHSRNFAHSIAGRDVDVGCRCKGIGQTD